MGLTDKQVQERWDANVRAVIDAKDAAARAREAYTEACKGVTAVTRLPGFRRRQLLGELTSADVDLLIEAESAVERARDAVQAADAVVMEAQIRFKAGVPEED